MRDLKLRASQREAFVAAEGGSTQRRTATATAARNRLKYHFREAHSCSDDDIVQPGLFCGACGWQVPLICLLLTR